MKRTLFKQKLASAAVVAIIGALTAQAADISYTTNITSGLFNGGSAFTVGNTTNGITVTISGSGAITNGSASIGPGAANSNNTMVVTGSGVWSNTSTLTIGSSGAFGGLVVSNGGAVYVTGGANSVIMGNNSSSSNNWALVTGVGSVWSNGAGTIIIGSASGGNTLTVSNNGTFYAGGQLHIRQTNNTVQVMDGGKFYVAGTFNIGYAGSSNVTMLISGPGAVAQASSAVNVGAESATAGNNSRLIVTNGGVFLNNSSLLVGGRGSIGAGVVVTGPGSKLDGTGNLLFGLNVPNPGTNGTLTVSDGGLVNANSSLAFYGLNNVLTNNGGILQFSTNTPTLTTLGTAGAVVMTKATLSYRNLAAGTVVNLTNNWGSSGVGAFTWKGTNTSGWMVPPRPIHWRIPTLFIITMDRPITTDWNCSTPP